MSAHARAGIVNLSTASAHQELTLDGEFSVPPRWPGSTKARCVSCCAKGRNPDPADELVAESNGLKRVRIGKVAGESAAQAVTVSGPGRKILKPGSCVVRKYRRPIPGLGIAEGRGYVSNNPKPNQPEFPPANQ